MKLWSLPLQQQYASRRPSSFRSSSTNTSALDSTTDTQFLKSPSSLFWLALHGLCCLVSLVLGFRFSRLAFFLLFSPTSTHIPSLTPLLHATAGITIPGSADVAVAANHSASRVVVGRHGIRIRPWPHPNPTEVMTAHAIIERVQKEQRVQYGVRNPRPVIAITPTYVRTFQALHMTGLMHSLMLIPYDLTWIVVEAGGLSNETANLLVKSRLKILHLAVEESMPVEWAARHKLEAKMRLRALSAVREGRLDGIVVFTDDSNMHSMELFDEIQKVSWFGAISVGILAHSGNWNPVRQGQENEENLPMPIQGPACDSSGRLVGWHTFNTLPYDGKRATYVGEDATVLPTKLEWAGFVFNSRLIWRDADTKPEWVRDFDGIADDDEGIGSPLILLKDASSVEPLGNCGKKVMLWWLRVEARADSKYPSGWIIDPPLEIVVPAKRTPWPGMPPEITSEQTTTLPDHADKRFNSRISRPRHVPHGKRKRETQTAGEFENHAQEK